MFTLEKLIAPEVTAFLDQSEIIHIGMADKAEIYLPSIDKHIRGQVLDINRSVPAVEDKAYYRWRGDKSRTASVKLRLFLDENAEQEVSAGLPAVVTFTKRPKSKILHSITASFVNL